MAIIGNSEEKKGRNRVVRLGDLLISAGLITQEQLEEGLRLQKGSVDDTHTLERRILINGTGHR